MAQDREIITKYPQGKFAMEPLGDKDWEPVLDEFIEASQMADCWLSAGLMLGLKRENRALPWDTDLDLGCWGGMHRDVEGFTLVRTVDVGDLQMQSVFLHEPTNILVDVTHYWNPDSEDVLYTERADGKLYRHKDVIFPLTHWETPTSIYKAPNSVNEYLALWYEDWRTTDKDWETKWVK